MRINLLFRHAQDLGRLAPQRLHQNGVGLRAALSLNGVVEIIKALALAPVAPQAQGNIGGAAEQRELGCGGAWRDHCVELQGIDGIAKGQQTAQMRQSLRRLDADDAGRALQALAKLAVARNEADIRNGAPADGEGGLAGLTPPPGEALKEGVGRHIGRLPRTADHGRGGGIDHEEIKGVAGRRSFQVQGAGDLRLKHRAKAWAFEPRDQPVVKLHGRMDDAAQRPVAAREALRQRGDRVPVAHIQSLDQHRHARSAQRVQFALQGVLDLTPARGENQSRRALSREPLGGGEAKAARAANDEIGAGLCRKFRRRHISDSVSGGADDDLADMFGGLHRPERGADFMGLACLVRKRLQPPRFEQVDEPLHDALDALAVEAQELIKIDAGIGDVAHEGPKAEMGVLKEVLLAKLHKAAEGLEQIKARQHGGAVQRVQHDINAADRRAHALHEPLAARVKHKISAQRGRQRATRLVAGRADDPAPGALGDLDRGEADAASSAVDEHVIALAHMGAFDKAVPGCREGDGNRGRRLQRNRLGDAHELPGGRRDMGGQRTAGEAHHPVADAKAFHPIADAQHHARTFKAQGGPGEASLQNVVVQNAKPHEHVAEIESRRRDLDLDLASHGRRAALLDPFKALDASRLTETQPALLVRPQGSARRHAAPDALDAHPIARDADFTLAPRIPKRPAQIHRARIIGHIDEAQADHRIFVDRNPDEATKRLILGAKDAALSGLRDQDNGCLPASASRQRQKALERLDAPGHLLYGGEGGSVMTDIDRHTFVLGNGFHPVGKTGDGGFRSEQRSVLQPEGGDERRIIGDDELTPRLQVLSLRSGDRGRAAHQRSQPSAKLKGCKPLHPAPPQGVDGALWRRRPDRGKACRAVDQPIRPHAQQHVLKRFGDGMRDEHARPRGQKAAGLFKHRLGLADGTGQGEANQRVERRRTGLRIVHCFKVDQGQGGKAPCGLRKAHPRLARNRQSRLGAAAVHQRRKHAREACGFRLKGENAQRAPQMRAQALKALRKRLDSAGRGAGCAFEPAQ